MMVRLSESRQQRALRRLRAMGAVNLDSITHFGDTAALLGPQDQVGVALSPAPSPLAPPPLSPAPFLSSPLTIAPPS